MEGFYRNSSEELFLKCLMESSNVTSSSSAGFRNLSLAQDFRADSEELFRSWLTNGDQSHVPNSSSIAHRTRQASRKISTEIASLSGQQQGNSLQSKNCNDPGAVEVSGYLSQNSVMTTAGKGLQASNLLVAKAWFNSSQPMTRSRSSELRKRYAAMQSAQTPSGLETMIDSSGNGVNKLKEEMSLTKIHLNDMSMYEVSNQLGTFTSPSNSSSSPLSNSHIASMDKVSSVVSMLKGTLQRKKLGNHADKEAVEDYSSNELSSVQEVILNNHFDGGQEAVMNNNNNFMYFSYGQMKEATSVQNVQSSIENDPEGFVNQTNTFQTSTVSREASQSESSLVLPIVSVRFDACDGPSQSGQTFSVCENTRKEIGSVKNSESGSKAKGFREQIIDNLKDDKKQRGGLVRYGSVTSADSVDRADPTKKRRVERSRKMAEAKERSSIPAVPTDMQAVLKRCENLEKEVRSLKLNLTFMNRKDSEQTKQIEDLQKQNDELTEEKERLLEEIERILAESGKM